MVPIADVFNHTDTHNVQVESEADVCLRCGGVHRGRCDGFFPSEAQKNTVDVRCIEYVDPEEEVVNTYGDLNNAELLCQYGFVLDSKTLFDRCSWAPDLACDRWELESALADVVCYTPSDEIHTPCMTQLLVELEPPFAQGQLAQDIESPPAYTTPEGRVLDFAPLQFPRDQNRPLFVDPTGRPSWCLWRFMIGAVLICRNAYVTGWPALLNHVHRHVRAIDAEEQRPTEVTARAQRCLRQLYTIRMQKIYALDHEEDALCHFVRFPLTQAQRGVLRSVVQLALQEVDTLHHALNST